MVPVFKEVSADLDTPVSSYLKLKKDDYSFLLESVEGQEKIARYSFLGANPSVVFRTKGKRVSIIRQGRTRAFDSDDPLSELKKLMKGFKGADIKGLPRFYGGFVGFIGYDMVRFFEDVPALNPEDPSLPDSLFMLADTILAFDHLNHKIKIVCNCFIPDDAGKAAEARLTSIYRDAQKRIDKISSQLKRPVPRSHTIEPSVSPEGSRLKIKSNFTKSQFCSIVNKAKRYIRAGDIIQVVLSQRLSLGIKKAPFDIYRKLRSLNPSPYMFFLKMGELVLIGSSPEMLVRCEDGVVETRPIAGTRKRGKDEAEDKRLVRELLQDAKEKAEHLMLVDLGRNDLGRICKSATVKVNEFMGVEKYSHVMHLVSDVSGELAKGMDAFDVLRACFPAGTVSGSPKIRAMEIIEELENLRRGPYAGCVGYFNFNRNMDTCITIRTIVINKARAFIQAGAGIVLDSVGEREYKESINKAKALIESLNS